MNPASNNKTILENHRQRHLSQYSTRIKGPLTGGKALIHTHTLTVTIAVTDAVTFTDTVIVTVAAVTTVTFDVQSLQLKD